LIVYALKKWNAHSKDLKKAISESVDNYSWEYKDMIKLVVRHILNGGDDDDLRWDENQITEIDNGDYQGTLLYVIPEDSYQPSEYQYLMTYVGYGSCSGCDTLQSIKDYGCEKPTESQVDQYMMLCKDIIQNLIKPYNIGWRDQEDFMEVNFEEVAK
jgi:hypothetical protein